VDLFLSTTTKTNMQAKFPSESLTTLTDLVLPSETNPLNNLFGGELLARMDRDTLEELLLQHLLIMSLLIVPFH
jgi:hypothetical protein